MHSGRTMDDEGECFAPSCPKKYLKMQNGSKKTVADHGVAVYLVVVEHWHKDHVVSCVRVSVVGGVVKSMTGESAQRAALGAGSIVMDILASNDKRLYHEKVKRIRELRPDMVLLSGGVDGGTLVRPAL